MNEAYRILIPTDFSETADYALEIGSKLAQQNRSETQILHVQNVLKHWAELAESSEGNLYRDIRAHIDKAKSQLNDRVEMARKLGVPSVEGFLEYDKGYRAILDYAEKISSDLIIMGAHGRTGLKGMLIGSYTQKVVNQGKIPVLAMKKTDGKNDLKRLVYLSDYDPDYANSVSGIAAFAKQMNVKVHFLCINTKLNFRETEETDANMKQYLSKMPDEMVESVDVINANMVEEGLQKYCKKQHIDIIAVDNYGKPHLAGVLGTTIENLINRLELPVLAIPVTES